ncbi:MAG: phosphate ABC transporter permease PstA, partial [Opitutaceae bacterium]|nr:phosphate ABC transporter permease PstA [Opitutaceae bacterium]
MNPPSPASSPNPFSARPGAIRAAERGLFRVFRIATWTVLLCGLLVFADIIIKGSGAVFGSFRATPSFPYFTNTFLAGSPETLHVFELDGQKHRMGDREFREFGKRREAAARAAGQAAPAPVRAESYAHSAGGIWPCIVGTVLLTTGSMTIALVLGVCSAIYLGEYARDGRFVRFIRLAIINLAGVPSIVFGLFGFGLFVIFFGWNVSLLAGWFTLAFMVLPVVITASEEALKAVPRGFREGALALGATKWQAIRTNVLPYAMPGILTSSILGIARVAGETAPIMFTAAYVVRDKLPWEVDRIGDFFFQSVMALPYHIYVVSSKIPQN